MYRNIRITIAALNAVVYMLNAIVNASKRDRTLTVIWTLNTCLAIASLALFGIESSERSDVDEGDADDDSEGTGSKAIVHNGVDDLTGTEVIPRKED